MMRIREYYCIPLYREVDGDESPILICETPPHHSDPNTPPSPEAPSFSPITPQGVSPIILAFKMAELTLLADDVWMAS